MGPKVLTFRVLGPVEVHRSGRILALGPRRHLELLCLLLIRPRTVVPAETLAQELWEGRPPATAANTLQGYVSGLRRVLEPDRAAREPASVLLTHSAGYSLDVADGAIDYLVFRTGVLDARRAADRGAGEEAGRLLRSALDLWRGPALVDVADASWAASLVHSLEEERLAAEELLAELSLASGAEVTDLVPVLQERLRAHPLRERTAAHLMRALYRSGRQAEALTVARQTRRLLGEELGVDPGPELRDTEVAILRHDDAVLRPAGQSASRPVRVQYPRPAGHAALPGRAHELEVLRRAAGRARGGATTAVLVTGEPGIGKSRLVDVLATELTDFRVLAGRCADLEGSPPYWPWRQVLSRLGASPSLEVSGSRFEQALSLAAQMRGEANTQPVAIVLDDLQWADVPSLELLELLLGEMDQARLLFVMIARGPVVEARLTRLLAALARHPEAARLDLDGVGLDGVTACLVEVLGRPVSRQAAEHVYRKSGGNPFFARELARLLDGDGRLAEGVPVAVRDVIRLRVASLPPAARELLASGAILGRDFALGTVTAMLDLQPQDAVAVVEALLHADLLVEPLAGRLRFTHALVHEAVRADISGVRTEALHARAAQALAARERPPAGVLAHHLLSARDVAGIAAAVAAAGENLEQLAVQPALELLDHAAAVADGQPVQPEVLEQLELLRGTALARLGRLDESHGVLVRVAEGSALRGDAELLGRAALAMASDGTVSGYWTMLAPVTGDPDEVMRWLRRALDLDPKDRRMAAALRATLATQLAVSGRPEPSLVEQAEAGSSGLAPDDRIRALTARWATLWTPRYAADRLTIARQVMELSEGHPQNRLAARHLLTTALLEVGDLSGSDAEFAVLADAIDRYGDPDFALLSVWWRAMRALMSGDLTGAQATAGALQKAIANAGGRAADTATLSMGTVSGIVAWERGVLGQAAAHLDAQGFTRHPGMEAVRALAHAQAGDPDEAHRILDVAFGRDLQHLGDDPTAIAPLILTSEVLALAGDRGQAAPLLERLAPHAEAVIVFAPGAVCMGAGTLYTGTAAALAGDLARARVDLEDAVTRNRKLGADPFTGRSLIRLSSVLQRTEPAADSQAMRAQAQALADTHGLALTPALPLADS